MPIPNNSLPASILGKFLFFLAKIMSSKDNKRFYCFKYGFHFCETFCLLLFNYSIFQFLLNRVSFCFFMISENITIVGRPDFVNNNFKIALYAKETQRYLCFNDHWKLVGMVSFFF